MAVLPSHRTSEETREESFGQFPLSNLLNGNTELSEQEKRLAAALGSKDPTALGKSMGKSMKLMNLYTDSDSECESAEPSKDKDPMRFVPKKFKRPDFKTFKDPKEGLRFSNQLSGLKHHGNVMEFASPPSAPAEEVPSFPQRTDSLPHLQATSSTTEDASSKRSSVEAGMPDRDEKKRKSLTFAAPSPGDDVFMKDYGYLAEADKRFDAEQNP